MSNGLGVLVVLGLHVLSWGPAGCVAGPSGKAVTVPSIQNARYPGIYEQPVQLTGGRFEGPPFQDGSASRPTVTLVDRLTVFGDFDGDDVEDAALLLVENSGGSGRFVYLGTVTTRKGNPFHTNTVLLGDRVQVRSLSLGDDRVEVDMLVAGPHDSMGRPTQKRRATYELHRGQLVETSSEDGGPVSTADLEGSSWGVVELDRERQASPDPEISATFAEDRLYGSSGCNRYSAIVTDGGAGKLSVGPILSTKMACEEPVMTQEREYLATLEHVTDFGFSYGQLWLTYERDGVTGVLVFDPRESRAEVRGSKTD